MRTSMKLSRIASKAVALTEARGDTLWTDDERESVEVALVLLESLSTQAKQAEYEAEVGR